MRYALAALLLACAPAPVAHIGIDFRPRPEPISSLTRLRVAAAFRRAGRLDEARQELDRLTALDATFPGLARERGLLHEAAGEYDLAAAACRRALGEAPDDVGLETRLGAVLVFAEQWQGALPILREVERAAPRSAEVRYLLGRALLLGDVYATSTAEARRHLEMAAELAPDRAEHFAFLALAANRMGDRSAAEAAIARALTLDPRCAEAHWQRAELLLREGQVADALAEVALTLQLRPKLYQAHALAARCHEEKQDAPAAEQAWRDALAGNDTIAEWHYRLARLLVDRGAAGEAKPHLRQAVDLVPPEQAPAWLWRANLLLGDALRDEDPERALRAYRAFIQLTTPDNGYRAGVEEAIRALER
jgi:tetratricopeptide (TPR) repeat protein